MKLLKYIFATLLLTLAFGANAQIQYKSAMSKFLGTWIEPKSIDYDGRLKVIIFKEDGELFVKAVFQFPDDLPTNRVTIPIESISYEDGELVTYGQRSIESKPSYKLRIEVVEGRLKVTEYVGVRGGLLRFISSHNLDVD